MMASWIIPAVVFAVIALVFYALWRINPGRFRLTARLWSISIDVEVDGQSEPTKLPPAKDEPTKLPPGAESVKLPPGPKPAELPPGSGGS